MPPTFRSGAEVRAAWVMDANLGGYLLVTLLELPGSGSDFFCPEYENSIDYLSALGELEMMDSYNPILQPTGITRFRETTSKLTRTLSYSLRAMVPLSFERCHSIGATSSSGTDIAIVIQLR